MTTALRNTLLAGALIATVTTASTASAQVIADSPKLPPKGGQYKSIGDVKYNKNLNIVLKNKLISDIRNPMSEKMESGEEKRFNAKLSGKLIDKNNRDKQKQFSLAGSVKKKILGREDAKQAGDFKLKVKAKDFKGEVDKFGKLYVRESPTVNSMGTIEIREIDNGKFEFLGSMDVNTEASRDGNEYRPASKAVMFSLVPVPEPAASSLLVLGCLGLSLSVWSRWRQR